MKKKTLMLVVSLLAVSSLMAAMAFSSALVPSQVTTSIVNTNTALVSVIANTDMAEYAKITDDGKMVLDFTKGNAGTASGFQPGSRYIFNNLFYLKNNTDRPIQVGLRFDSLYANKVGNHPQGLHIITTSKNVEGYSVLPSYSNALVHFDGNTFTSGVYEGRYITLQPNEQVGLNWDFHNTGDLMTQSSTCTLQIHARDAKNATTTSWQ